MILESKMAPQKAEVWGDTEIDFIDTINVSVLTSAMNGKIDHLNSRDFRNSLYLFGHFIYVKSWP